jgi:hypothetical protein
MATEPWEPLTDEQSRACCIRPPNVENVIAGFSRYGAEGHPTLTVSVAGETADDCEEIHLRWDRAMDLRDFLNRAVPLIRAPSKTGFNVILNTPRVAVLHKPDAVRSEPAVIVETIRDGVLIPQVITREDAKALRDELNRLEL